MGENVQKDYMYKVTMRQIHKSAAAFITFLTRFRLRSLLASVFISSSSFEPSVQANFAYSLYFTIQQTIFALKLQYLVVEFLCHKVFNVCLKILRQGSSCSKVVFASCFSARCVSHFTISVTSAIEDAVSFVEVNGLDSSSFIFRS